MLVAELLRRGYTEDEIKKLVNRNILRVMRAAEAVAGKTK
jgi:microsomal dipeptidase-like Zn-dependent dipeptidase